jgi:Tol biopolymer transport system component
MPAYGATGGNLAASAVEGGRTELIHAGSVADGALWSPDGRWIVYRAGMGANAVTKLYDCSRRTSRDLKLALDPPYAWREDGMRLAGCVRDEKAGLDVAFYNVTELGETLRVPTDVENVKPGSMVWLPDTDDVMFVGTRAGRSDVCSVEAGQFRTISTSGDVLALALDRRSGSIVWARSSRNTRYILLSLYAFDLTRRSVSRLPFPSRVPGINPDPASSPARVAGVALSPSSGRIAVVAVYSSGGPSRRSGHEAAKLFSVKTDGQGARLVRKAESAAGEAAPAPLAPFWSNDGAALGVVHSEPGNWVVAVFASDGARGHVVARSGSSP